MTKLIELMDYTKELNIVAVDDNHSARELIKRSLTKENFYSLKIFEDLDALWEFLNLEESEGKVDALILDLNFLKNQGFEELTWMDEVYQEKEIEKAGFRFVREFKEKMEDLYNKTKIIFFSADIDNQNYNQMKSYCDGHHYYSKENGFKPIIDLLNYIEIEKERNQLPLDHQEVFNTIMDISYTKTNQDGEVLFFSIEGEPIKLTKKFPNSLLSKIHSSKLIKINDHNFINPNVINFNAKHVLKKQKIEIFDKFFLSFPKDVFKKLRKKKEVLSFFEE